MTRQRARSPPARPGAPCASAVTATSLAGMTTVSPRPRRAAKSIPAGRPARHSGGRRRADRRSAARVGPLRGAVEADQLPGGGGVLRGLVVAPPPGETREPHGQPGVVLDLPPAGAVGR